MTEKVRMERINARISIPRLKGGMKTSMAFTVLANCAIR
jgi:hypothetical protein